MINENNQLTASPPPIGGGGGGGTTGAQGQSLSPILGMANNNIGQGGTTYNTS